MDVVDEGAIASGAQAIENGEVHPNTRNHGTVSVGMSGPDGYGSCSGQIISRDTILTAAHCLYGLGFYTDGWQSQVSVSIQVTRQNSDGNWDHLTPGNGGNTVTALGFVQEMYVDHADAGSEYRHGWDVALLRTPNVLAGVVGNDVAAVARNSSDRPDRLSAYGYGYYTDNGYDGRLRRGDIEDLTWYGLYGWPNARVVKSDYGINDPHICQGDSGGPWLADAPSSGRSGVVFGVSSYVWGTPACGESWAKASRTAYHDPWIEDIVEAGRGYCGHSNLAIRLQSNSGTYTNVSTLLCW